MRRAILVFTLLFLVGCAQIDHPYDDPNRDECARQEHGHLTRNCHNDPLQVPRS